MKRIIGIFGGVLLSISALFAQTTISYNGSGNFILRERSNLRRYDNGKYIGLVSTEVSSFIIPMYIDGGYLYEGSFYIAQDTRNKLMNVYRGYNESIPAKFRISETGAFTMLEDHGFPTFRGFPTYTNKMIKIGDSWSAKAERAVDPLNKGIITKMPIYVQYTYMGDEVFNGEPVYLISAQWATRYGSGFGVVVMDWGGDKDLVQATGSHKARIYVSKATGNALVIHDTVDETFEYADGNKYTYRGQISQFTEYPPAIDKYKILDTLQRVALITKEDVQKVRDSSVEKDDMTFADDMFTDTTNQTAMEEMIDPSELFTDTTNQIAKADASGDSFTKKANGNTIRESLRRMQEGELVQPDELDDISNGDSRQNRGDRPQKSSQTSAVSSVTAPQPLITVEDTELGLRLTIPNLQFLPNSAQLVPGEKDRLDKIAIALLQAPDAKLLIEGHTARIGRQDDELQLSEDRANTIASELVKRGIKLENLICKGRGGSKPIADNGTAEGRELNRRVEITILQ